MIHMHVHRIIHPTNLAKNNGFKNDFFVYISIAFGIHLGFTLPKWLPNVKVSAESDHLALKT